MRRTSDFLAHDFGTDPYACGWVRIRAHRSVLMPVIRSFPRAVRLRLHAAVPVSPTVAAWTLYGCRRRSTSTTASLSAGRRKSRNSWMTRLASGTDPERAARGRPPALLCHEARRSPGVDHESE